MEKDTARIGSVVIGPGRPVAVQTMWDRPLTEIDSRFRERLDMLKALGCDMIRFAVPGPETLPLLSKAREGAGMPVIADIHFDYALALACLDIADKIRINPGNIGAPWKVREFLSKAAGNGVCIRIGINAGSLPGDLRRRTDTASAMIEAAERELEAMRGCERPAIVFSLKSSDIETTGKANVEFRKRHSYPLHIGLTEAGPIIPGMVKSTLALIPLLECGIGDTIRVSLSDSPENEVIAARQILRAAGKSENTISVVSCPQCGRASFPVRDFLERLGPRLYAFKKRATVAIMGCVVIGPEEAKHADIGITGSGNSIVLFRHGGIVKRVTPDEALPAFIAELEKL